MSSPRSVIPAKAGIQRPRVSSAPGLDARLRGHDGHEQCALIVDAVRTPRGRGSDKGSLRALEPVRLLAQALRALHERSGFDTGQVREAAIGCVTQAAQQGSHIGKLGVIEAGWSDAVPALTVNRYCASGLSAVLLAAREALAGDGIAIGGGVEMMSRVPMASDGGPLTHDAAFQQRARLVPIGIAADAVATMDGYSRQDCDAYALASQQRAAAAAERARPDGMVPVHDAAGVLLLERDETPRPQTSAASLAALAPAFADMGQRQGWDATIARHLGLPAIEHVHHAGNSPAMADGASAVLVASARACERLGLRPRARILGCATVGVDRTIALTGAVDATRAALAQAGLGVQEIDLFEVNESFAALMLHYMRHLGVPHERLNVAGGAIALGHAMGSTGSALVGTLLEQLRRRDARHGVVAICGAAGLAVAMVVERLA